MGRLIVKLTHNAKVKLFSSDENVMYDELKAVYDSLMPKHLRIGNQRLFFIHENCTIQIDEDEDFWNYLLLQDAKEKFDKTASFKVIISVQSFDGTEFDNTVNDTEHPDIICDCCDKMIFGIRYKCFRCSDYDLCSVCINKKIHDKSHLFLRIVDPITPEQRSDLWNRQEATSSIQEMLKNFTNHQNTNFEFHDCGDSNHDLISDLMNGSGTSSTATAEPINQVINSPNYFKNLYSKQVEDAAAVVAKLIETEKATNQTSKIDLESDSSSVLTAISKNSELITQASKKIADCSLKMFDVLYNAGNVAGYEADTNTADTITPSKSDKTAQRNNSDLSLKNGYNLDSVNCDSINFQTALNGPEDKQENASVSKSLNIPCQNDEDSIISFALSQDGCSKNDESCSTASRGSMNKSNLSGISSSLNVTDEMNESNIKDEAKESIAKDLSFNKSGDQQEDSICLSDATSYVFSDFTQLSTSLEQGHNNSVTKNIESEINEVFGNGQSNALSNTTHDTDDDFEKISHVRHNETINNQSMISNESFKSVNSNFDEISQLDKKEPSVTNSSTIVSHNNEHEALIRSGFELCDQLNSPRPSSVSTRRTAPNIVDRRPNYMPNGSNVSSNWISNTDEKYYEQVNNFAHNGSINDRDLEEYILDSRIEELEPDDSVSGITPRPNALLKDDPILNGLINCCGSPVQDTRTSSPLSSIESFVVIDDDKTFCSTTVNEVILGNLVESNKLTESLHSSITNNFESNTERGITALGIVDNVGSKDKSVVTALSGEKNAEVVILGDSFNSQKELDNLPQELVNVQQPTKIAVSEEKIEESKSVVSNTSQNIIEKNINQIEHAEINLPSTSRIGTELQVPQLVRSSEIKFSQVPQPTLHSSSDDEHAKNIFKLLNPNFQEPIVETKEVVTKCCKREPAHKLAPDYAKILERKAALKHDPHYMFLHPNQLIASCVEKIEGMAFDNCNGWITRIAIEEKGDFNVIFEKVLSKTHGN
uniref:ZZ-type domain-containing protein n=1 Tax=Rhabditophanes sp. KR3021 TaxID=114890 RepID=A0AC35UB28_9BILA